MNTTPLTRLAIIGTMSDLHNKPIPYNLACLQKLVAGRNPDLLSAEITTEAWENSDLTSVELEVREALVPVEVSTDIVLIPIAPSLRYYAEFAPVSGWRQRVAHLGIKMLRWGQQKAGVPEAIHGRLLGAFCHTVCALNEAVWTPEERAAWDHQNWEMVEAILQAVRRDPGCRVLVVAQCQRFHRLKKLLKNHLEELELVQYEEL
jgi:hypothetical protein